MKVSAVLAHSVTISMVMMIGYGQPECKQFICWACMFGW